LKFTVTSLPVGTVCEIRYAPDKNQGDAAIFSTGWWGDVQDSQRLNPQTIIKDKI
jgi:hypothetical protein